MQDEEAVKRLTASAGTKSKLAKPVQELIKMIFDVESMKKAMVEFEVRHFNVRERNHIKPVVNSKYKKTQHLHRYKTHSFKK